MKELLTWLYGRSGRNAHIRAMAEKTLLILKEKQSMEHQALAKELGIELDQYQKPKRTFYFVVNPLVRASLIQKKRVYSDDKRKSYETHYIITPEQFHGYMKRTIDEFASSLKTA